MKTKRRRRRTYVLHRVYYYYRDIVNCAVFVCVCVQRSGRVGRRRSGKIGSGAQGRPAGRDVITYPFVCARAAERIDGGGGGGAQFVLLFLRRGGVPNVTLPPPH